MNTSSNATAAMLLRLTLGTILLAHGLLKLLVFTLAGTVGYFESLGLPAIAAYLTIFGELAGGAALILGLYTRLTALATLPILVGATWVHLANGWVFSNQGGGWEFPLLLTMLAVIVAIQGAGKFALRKLPVIDAWIPNAVKS
ncbi:DoxX family protein [Arenicella xantha]|uniref:Putative oxidoreductase n=1 Tax=Arenicella xantha TaxID=644221 RepID=A0A395JN24_9GAMM|nr:DoxX family protein [Arenicella xantha]RBP52693.1 putative oxidoreductase [Arenicella xantha]